MNRSYQRYPRGFLGAIISATGQGDGSNISRIDTLKLSFGSTSANPDNLVPSNPEINELYNRYLHHSAEVATFQFYEQILVAALKAFGTSNFKEWLNAQAQTSTTDYLHALFLQDTVRFIFTGKREMLIENWIPRLSHSHTVDNTVVLENRNADAFSKMLLDYESSYPKFGNRQHLHYGLDVTIWHWVQQPNGITDLLKTLYILFGK